jgi:parvulin-like peptidyl-prolyl isomerase
MSIRSVIRTTLLAALATGGAAPAVHGADPALPVREGRPVVATVGADTISLDELVMELERPPDPARLARGLATASELELLDRLVSVRLVVQEASAMGIAEQPEVRKQVEVSARGILRDVLFEHLVKDVEADPAVVDEKFKDLARQWRTSSLLFQDQAAATRAHEALAGGTPFDDVAAQAVKAGTARRDADADYHGRKEYIPAIANAIAALAPGHVTPVIALPAGFALVRVEEVRYPEDADARAQAKAEALRARQLAALQAHEEQLRHDLVVTHDEVLKSVDYAAATPGLEALMKDPRVIVTIKGGAPVTVADLTEYMRMQSLHGPDQAAQRNRMNATKEQALHATVGRRLLNMEAIALGLETSHEYRDRVRSHENGLVFDHFVQKVIAPDSKVTDEEVQGYYDTHVKEYSSPAMIRMRSLAFTERVYAESAMQKLREGADFGWLVSNAEGQVPKAADDVLVFDGRPVTTDSMPEGLRQAVANARGGESRLYAAGDGHFYVLVVQDVIAPVARPYAEVRDEAAKTVYGQKLRRNVEEYIAKLRAASTIAIFLKRAQ